MPAIGIMTVSDMFLIMLKTDGEKADGVVATSDAIAPTSSFTQLNIELRQLMR